MIEKQLKIMYIWDICDFGKNISNFILNHNLGKAKVIKKEGMPIRFGLLVILQLLYFRPNIVHVHYWTKGVILTKFFSRAKIIMHFHGSELRGKIIPNYVEKWSTVLVSTRDLLKPGYEYYGFPTW